MTKPVPFEQSISELEEIVRQLEKGELTLEDSLKQFEKGISLARGCQDVLKEAEQKIEMLTATQTDSSSKTDESASD
ncbi:MAG: exodeoxyribonuclease VII small subunit [Legionella sp.]|nr:MAG: exodeoxyribonuclease VII small subunit [Legionella sp.]